MPRFFIKMRSTTLVRLLVLFACGVLLPAPHATAQMQYLVGVGACVAEHSQHTSTCAAP